MCLFRFRKNARSMHSAQRKVEFRRLGNQLPVLGKANSLCRIVKCCVFCMFVKLQLSPWRVGLRDKDIPGYRNSGKILVASRRCTSCAPWRREKILTPAFYSFSSALSRFFVRWCWHLFRSKTRLSNPRFNGAHLHRTSSYWTSS